MKRYFCFVLCVLFACTLMTVTSCTSPDDTAARGFVTRIINNFTKPNADSVRVLYPGAEKCTAFHTRLLESKDLKLKAGSDGEWTCSVGDSLRIIFVEGKDENEGVFTIKESYGFANFGADCIRFALGTGWVDKSMNDVAMAERIADKSFVEWLGKDFIESVKKNIKCQKTKTFGDERDEGKWICADGIVVTVSNYNDYPVPGECYEILAVETSPGMRTDSVFQPGDDLPPHAKVPVRVEIFHTLDSKVSQKLSFVDANLLNLIYRNYKPKGTEYRDFKKQK